MEVLLRTRICINCHEFYFASNLQRWEHQHSIDTVEFDYRLGDFKISDGKNEENYMQRSSVLLTKRTLTYEKKIRINFKMRKTVINRTPFFVLI